MPFDFKKEYRDLYMPKKTPSLIEVAEIPFVAVRGQGDPNQPDGAYQQAIRVLYAVAYTLRMSHRSGRVMEGFFEYVVPPLEGFWVQADGPVVDYANKSGFHWISAIRLPDFVRQEDFDWAIGEAARKKKLDCSSAQLWTFEEGLCVQLLHTGPYDDEPASVARIDAFLAENGYETDFTDRRLHHEIYLSDPRKTAPEKWKTVIRHPVRKKKV